MGCKYKVSGDGSVAWIALGVAVSPETLFVCLAPDAAQQVHAPRFISLLFVKRSRTLWIQHGFFLRGREEMCFLGRAKSFGMGVLLYRELTCLSALLLEAGEATLVIPSKLSELPDMAQQPDNTLCFSRLQISVVWDKCYFFCRLLGWFGSLFFQ